MEECLPCSLEINLHLGALMFTFPPTIRTVGHCIPLISMLAGFLKDLQTWISSWSVPSLLPIFSLYSDYWKSQLQSVYFVSQCLLMFRINFKLTVMIWEIHHDLLHLNSGHYLVFLNSLANYITCCCLLYTTESPLASPSLCKPFLPARSPCSFLLSRFSLPFTSKNPSRGSPVPISAHHYFRLTVKSNVCWLDQFLS